MCFLSEPGGGGPAQSLLFIDICTGNSEEPSPLQVAPYSSPKCPSALGRVHERPACMMEPGVVCLLASEHTAGRYEETVSHGSCGGCTGGPHGG